MVAGFAKLAKGAGLKILSVKPFGFDAHARRFSVLLLVLLI